MIEQRYAPRSVAVVTALASAAAAGIGFGVLTLWMQGHLEGNWSVLANSGAVWTVVAVLIAGVVGTTVPRSAAAGTVALVGEVAGYYWLAAPWHGIAVTQSDQVLWTAAALTIGPFAGLAGFGLVRSSVAHRGYSLLCIAGVLVGEGLFELAQVPEHRLASQLETVLGLALGLVTLLLSRAAVHHRMAALVLGAAVASAVLAVYTAPTLVL